MRQVDIAAWKYVNLLSIKEFLTFFIIIIIYFLWKQYLFQKSVGGDFKLSTVAPLDKIDPFPYIVILRKLK